jgi:hypothetical protein
MSVTVVNEDPNSAMVAKKRQEGKDPLEGKTFHISTSSLEVSAPEPAVFPHFCPQIQKWALSQLFPKSQVPMSRLHQVTDKETDEFVKDAGTRRAYLAAACCS